MNSNEPIRMVGGPWHGVVLETHPGTNSIMAPLRTKAEEGTFEVDLRRGVYVRSPYRYTAEQPAIWFIYQGDEDE